MGMNRALQLIVVSSRIKCVDENLKFAHFDDVYAVRTQQLCQNNDCLWASEGARFPLKFNKCDEPN